jgi:hypothetical protein
VPAVGVKASVLESDQARAFAGHVITAVLQAIGDRELRRGNRSRRRGEHKP